MATYPLLINAPAHDTPAFIRYLRKHNKVIYESNVWIGIENCKYHQPDHPHYTFFTMCQRLSLPDLQTFEWQEWQKIMQNYQKWFVFINSQPQKSVDRFHFHVCRDQFRYYQLLFGDTISLVT